MEKLKMFFNKIGKYLYSILLTIIGVLMMVLGMKNRKVASQKKEIERKEQENVDLKNRIVATDKASEGVASAYEQNMKTKDEEGKQIAQATGTSEHYNDLIEGWNNET